MHSKPKCYPVVRTQGFRIVHRNIHLAAVESRREFGEIDIGQVKGRRDILAAVHPSDGLWYASCGCNPDR